MKDRTIAKLAAGAVVGMLAIFVLALWGCPQYNVYSKRQSGKAKLAEAEHSRKVAIEEAKAEEEAALHRAKARIEIAKAEATAEVERSKGVAEANRIIGASLKGNETYLKYLWVNALRTGKNDVIYVPTETNLPLLEANRLSHRKK